MWKVGNYFMHPSDKFTNIKCDRTYSVVTSLAFFLSLLVYQPMNLCVVVKPE